MLIIQRLLIVSVVFSVTTSSSSSSSDWLIKQSHLIKTGFTNILWEYIDSSDLKINDKVSSKCKLSLNYVNQSIGENQVWPVKLIESSGRIPNDFSGSGYVDLGDFDQCLQLTWTNYNGNNQVGSYCLTSFLPNNQNLSENIFTRNKVIYSEYGANIKIGFCLPADCSSNDLSNIASNAFKPYDWNLISVDHCTVHSTFTEKLIDASTTQKICFLLLIVIVAIVLVSNVLELINNQKSSNWLRHFSFQSSYQQIVQPNWSSNKMTSLLEYSTMMHLIVIISHMISVPLLFNASTLIAVRLQDYLNLDRNFLMSITLSDWYFEGIFAYGGFARSLEIWKKIGPRTTFFQLIVSTLTKLLSLSILTTIILIVHINLPLISSGPFQITEKATNSCLGFFWQTIFLNNNQAENVDQLCLLHFWSVSVESQCLLVIVTLIFLYKRYPKIGLTCNLIVMFSSLFYVGYLYYHHQYSAHLLSQGISNIEALEDYNVNIYTRSSTHLWIYCMTVLCTYLIMNDYVPIILKNQLLQTINSNIFFFGTFLFAFQPIYMKLIKPHQNQLILAIYSVVHRFFMLVFFLFCGFRMADEAKSVFSPPLDNNNNQVKTLTNGHSHTHGSNGHLISNGYNQQKATKQLITSNDFTKFKFFTILATILRSTYCIHITLLLITFNSLRQPLTSSHELLILGGLKLIICLIGGLLFHFIVLGPFTSIMVSIRKEIHSK